MLMTNVELEARIRVLEKLCERIFDAVADAKVAGKTADKALAMAQEALVVVTSQLQQRPAGEPSDPFSDPFAGVPASDPYMTNIRVPEPFAPRQAAPAPTPEPDFPPQSEEEMSALLDEVSE